MEEKKEKKGIKISFSTFFLILAIIIIFIMSYFIYKFYSEKMMENDKVANLNSKVSNLENTIEILQGKNNGIANTLTNDNSIKNKEIISIDSSFGKNVNEYLTNIWVAPEVYKNCIAEFQDVKNASKEYLAACASFGVMHEVSNDIYNAKVRFEEFNNVIVKLFGDNANGLLKESDIENVPFVEKNSDNTYHFSGFCGSEGSSTDYSIKDIQKEDDLFYVDLYEYETETDQLVADLVEGQETFESVYDRNYNLITKITIKVTENNYCKMYDEKGNEIDSIKKLLVTEYKDKLSVRQIELKYIEDNNFFIMLNNKLK